MAKPTITDKFNNWGSSTNTNIERSMDNTAYSAAHPDDTLVFAGPPRIVEVDGIDSGVFGEYAAIGMLQNISITQSKPFQPMMALGSSRSFYLGGKAQGTAQIGRLFLNTDSLLKRVYSNIIPKVEGGTANTGISPFSGSDVIKDNPAGDDSNKNLLINLDSEFFLIPFGLGVIFKNKARETIGGFYMELAVIPNYTVSVQAGQSMIMEGVAVLFDRLIPLGHAAAGITAALDTALTNG